MLNLRDPLFYGLTRGTNVHARQEPLLRGTNLHARQEPSRIIFARKDPVKQFTNSPTQQFANSEEFWLILRNRRSLRRFVEEESPDNTEQSHLLTGGFRFRAITASATENNRLASAG